MSMSPPTPLCQFSQGLGLESPTSREAFPSFDPEPRNSIHDHQLDEDLFGIWIHRWHALRLSIPPGAEKQTGNT